MTTTSDPVSFGVAEGTAEPELSSGRVRPRRQPRWMAAGVLAIALGGLGATLLWQEFTTAHQVVVVQRAVPRGEVIRAADLRAVEVGSVSEVSTVPAAEIPDLVGQKALVDLAEDSMLPRGAVGVPSLPEGLSQIGLKLAPGRLPIGELPVGTPVRLIVLEDPRQGAGQPASAQAGSGQPASAQAGSAQAGSVGAQSPGVVKATIASPIRIGPDGVATLVDVHLDRGMAGQVAGFAATERLVLVKETGD